MNKAHHPSCDNTGFASRATSVSVAAKTFSSRSMAANGPAKPQCISNAERHVALK